MGGLQYSPVNQRQLGQVWSERPPLGGGPGVGAAPAMADIVIGKGIMD